MDILNKIPPTFNRVEACTKAQYNEAIKQNIIENINNFNGKSNEILSDRINQLNNEWDTERVLQAEAAALILLSSIKGLFARRYSLITGLVGGCLLYHAIKGWCPTLQTMRKMCIRTPKEINTEKSAMKFFRGDFNLEGKNANEIYDSINKD